MDTATIIGLITSFATGGPAGIIAFLVVVVIILLREISRLHAEISRKDDKYGEVIEDYYKGSLSLAEALNSFKALLLEIKGH